MTKSMKQLLAEGTVRRGTTLYKVSYQDIVVDPGFNKRVADSPETQKHVQSLLNDFKAGDKFPPLSCQLMEDEKWHLRDGHE